MQANTTQHTKNNKTHNKQHEPPLPYPPAALPSIAMATSTMASNQGTETPCESDAGARRRVHAHLSLFLCLGRWHIPHQKIERWAWLPFNDLAPQSTWELAERHWGRDVKLFGQSNWSTKKYQQLIYIGLRWLLIGNFIRNNQPKTCGNWKGWNG